MIIRGRRGSQQTNAGAAAIALLGIVVTALSITTICINQYQLFNVTTWCSSYSYWHTTCAVSGQCWFSTEPLYDFSPCQYLSSLGSIAIFFQFLISLASCISFGTAISCMIVLGLSNTAWWIAGAVFFTQQRFKVDAMGDIPAGYYRRVAEAVNWTATAVSVLQVVAMFSAARAMRADNYKLRAEYDSGMQGQEMPSYGAPPPAAPTYPPPLYGAPPPGYPPAGMAPMYPPPPTGAAQYYPGTPVTGYPV